MRFDCFSKNKYLDAFKQQHSLHYGNTKKETKFIYVPQKFERSTYKEKGKTQDLQNCMKHRANIKKRKIECNDSMITQILGKYSREKKNK